MSNKKLNELTLTWSTFGESELQENVEEILDVLQPNIQQLQILSVYGYKGSYFPQWMSAPSLKELTLRGCKNCLQLPPLGKLPSLKKLDISGMDNVKYIYEEFCDGGVFINALKSLSLGSLPNLVKLSREDGENMFPRLSTLDISNCPKLLAEEVLVNGLHSLKTLQIWGCDKLNVSAGFQCLTCLEYLFIGRCREVEGLDGALQRMTSLKRLTLRNLRNLESLPDCFGDLPLLRDLSIWHCDKLRCLPTSLRHSRLGRLCISGELGKRCEKETGEDWPNIAHIPYIDVI